MRSPRAILFACFAPFVLAFTAIGCSAITGIGDDDENEVSVTVQEIGADFLVGDGIRYLVTEETEYEGLAGLSDLAVGDVVEIEYEAVEGSDDRRALEIEIESADDDDNG